MCLEAVALDEHTAAQHGFLVDGDEDGVGGDAVVVRVDGFLHPVFQHVLQLEGIVAP